MILLVKIDDKSYGDKQLYNDVFFEVQAHEKVGLVGRNGSGKTTLFNILTGQDKDYAGKVEIKHGLRVIASRQEHDAVLSMTVLDYILSELPEYSHLKHIIDTYPATMGDSTRKITEYSEAIERFSHLGYYEIEEQVLRSLVDYQIDEVKARDLVQNLSGGQKRFAELVKIQFADADLVLVDEPTNHMDFAAKELFISWLNSTKAAVVVITHDRDVLRAVDRIVELRDGQAMNFKGNYDSYLRVNAVKVLSEVNEYSLTQRRIENLKEAVIRYRRLKEKSRDPGTIGRFKALQHKAENELAELQTKDKPSFWIDRESAEGLNSKLASAYDTHKAKNIRLSTRSSESSSSRLLIEAKDLSLGYNDHPVFTGVNFQLREGERLRLHGRNGAGKSTLVRTILAHLAEGETSAQLLHGKLETEPELKVGVYEQELATEYLDNTLYEAIENSLRAKNLPIHDSRIRQLMSDYLFDPYTDSKLAVRVLSGGQKARLQLISMLAGDPIALILDEPTNHLDLPSIEELEQALVDYHGAIIYISHDSYFTSRIGGEVVQVGDK